MLLGYSAILTTADDFHLTLPSDAQPDPYDTTSAIPSWIVGDRTSECDSEYRPVILKTQKYLLYFPFP